MISEGRQPLRTAASRPQALRVHSCGLTNIGMVRKVNEDCFTARDKSCLYIVADGIGGHVHGDLAAKLAVNAMLGHLACPRIDNISRTGGIHPHTLLLKQSVEAANKKILAAIRDNPSLRGMGTTVVAGMLREQIMAIAHVGDSRAYRRRDGQLEQLTDDHSWVNENQLSEAQARHHPLKNIVTRALGTEAAIKVELLEVKARPGDLYLLCSDGLTTMLKDRHINRLLSAIDTPNVSVSLEEICKALIQGANTLGGNDNVTVVLVQIAEKEEMT